MKEWMTITEAAEYLGVHRETVRKKVKDGDLTGYESGRDSRVTLLKTADLDTLLTPRQSA